VRGATVVVADMSRTRRCDQKGAAGVSRACRQAAADGVELRLVMPLAKLGRPQITRLGPLGSIDAADEIVAHHRWLIDLAESLGVADSQHRNFWDDGVLASFWDQLADEVELDLQAEEEICYLPVYRSSPPALAQMQEAIAENDDIREAVADAQLRRVGSAALTSGSSAPRPLRPTRSPVISVPLRRRPTLEWPPGQRAERRSHATAEDGH
jgi:hypothetical protein